MESNSARLKKKLNEMGYSVKASRKILEWYRPEAQKRMDLQKRAKNAR